MQSDPPWLAVTMETLERLKPRFEGQTALIFATGPSLPKLWDGRASGLPKIAVKDAWVEVPDADLLVCSEQSWWPLRHPESHIGYRGPKFGYAPGILEVYRLHGRWGVPYVHKPGWLGLDPPCNSGNHAVQIAAQLGAKRIVLVGFDMRGGHFFNNRHLASRVGGSPWSGFVKRFGELGDLLKAQYGVELLNATPGSALAETRIYDNKPIGPYVPSITLDEVL